MHCHEVVTNFRGLMVTEYRGHHQTQLHAMS